MTLNRRVHDWVIAAQKEAKNDSWADNEGGIPPMVVGIKGSHALVVKLLDADAMDIIKVALLLAEMGECDQVTISSQMFVKLVAIEEPDEESDQPPPEVRAAAEAFQKDPSSADEVLLTITIHPDGEGVYTLTKFTAFEDPREIMWEDSIHMGEESPFSRFMPPLLREILTQTPDRTAVDQYVRMLHLKVDDMDESKFIVKVLFPMTTIGIKAITEHAALVRQRSIDSLVAGEAGGS